MKATVHVCFCVRLAAIVLFCVALECCGYVEYRNNIPFPDPKPDYRRIIAHNLQHHPGLFEENPEPTLNKSDTLGPLEISGIRWVQHHTEGWVWLACLRAHPAGRALIDFAIFIRRDRVVDIRTSVISDGCASQNYESFAR